MAEWKKKSMVLNRLNLGSGYVTPENWVNVDVIPNTNTIVADVRYGLPFGDNYFDFVLMNHTLQSFHYDELPTVLKEVRRVMKEGAALRILTPDVMDKMYDFFDPDSLSSDFKVPVSNKIESTRSGRLLRWIFWHGDTRCAFSYDSLEDLLNRNGFTKVKLEKFGECELDSRKNESLIVEGIK